MRQVLLVKMIFILTYIFKVGRYHKVKVWRRKKIPIDVMVFFAIGHLASRWLIDCSAYCLLEAVKFSFFDLNRFHTENMGRHLYASYRCTLTQR